MRYFTFFLFCFCSNHGFSNEQQFQIVVQDGAETDEVFQDTQDIVSFQQRWGLHHTQKQSDVDMRKRASRVIGWVYLIFRSMEYNLKIPALLLEDQEAVNACLLAGLCCGNVGNLLQGYQGAFDWKTYEYQEDFVISAFAIVAILRGTGNAVSDSIAIASIYKQSQALSYASGVVGISTDVMGFVKNVKDVFKTKGVRKTAFSLCTLSRFPFLLSGVLGLISIDVTRVSIPSTQALAALTAMCLFNSGAFIRLYFDFKQIRLDRENHRDDHLQDDVGNLYTLNTARGQRSNAL